MKQKKQKLAENRKKATKSTLLPNQSLSLSSEGSSFAPRSSFVIPGRLSSSAAGEIKNLDLEEREDEELSADDNADDAQDPATDESTDELFDELATHHSPVMTSPVSQLPQVSNTAQDLTHSESDSTALLPSQGSTAQDPLRRYLEEIRHYPLLDAHQEFDLAIELRETGDLRAAKKLVSANLRLVVKIAFEYRMFYSNVLDLIQEGNMGLMKAVSKFEPHKGARLGYYASWWIRSYILKYLLDNFRLVKLGTTQAQKKLFYHLMKEKEKLEAQGLVASPRLLSEKLNVREKDVIEMEQRLSGRGGEMSLDAPIDQDSEGTPTSYLDLLKDQTEGADVILAQNQLLDLLHERLPHFAKTLSEKELRILQDRILAEEPKTLQELADLYSLTRERARQIEAKVLEKLKVFLKDYI